ncbi:hypothetical protein [Rivibacter subsaxonicus]|uniref:Uncharacterized protein n=1 Tax=Rivibacter subsaxonicus TaxID=457575 RepID=A0A4Q7VVH1_9BURK|nr:hypothetical protein [Rivibacter subsaxonicus]RZU00630.1 hypothetical protein EV670_1341 [Rivibacter subsaxonicus]
MTQDFVSVDRRLATSTHVAVLLTVGAVLGGLGFSSSAREQAPQALAVHATAGTHAELERAFWVCDHAATKQLIDMGTAAACSRLTEELKKKKFNGSFDAMLAWWRQNKAPEHQALDVAGRPTADR